MALHRRAAKRDTAVMRKPHKYGAVRTDVDGVTFASKREAKRYQELKLWEKAGGIRHLVLQPSFDLWAFSVDPATAQKVGAYKGDFAYEECDHANGHRDWKPIVEDVKGFKTPLYRWKKRHVEAQYGIQIREV